MNKRRTAFPFARRGPSGEMEACWRKVFSREDEADYQHTLKVYAHSPPGSVPDVLEHGDTPNGFYITMTHGGDPIGRYLEGGEYHNIQRAVSDYLGGLHEKGLHHGDLFESGGLHPGNILRRSDGGYVFIDPIAKRPGKGDTEFQTHPYSLSPPTPRKAITTQRNITGGPCARSLFD